MAHEPEILEDEDAAPSTEQGATALVEKLAAIKRRCVEANIDFEQDEIDSDPFATISIQAGKSKRSVVVFSEDKADALLRVKFERYRFLAGYEAIYCHDENTIEAGLRVTRMAPANLMRRLSGERGLTVQPPSPVKTVNILPGEELQGRPVLTLGPSSPELSALSYRSSQFSLKLIGARAAQHDQALTQLRSYADSLFFQIDAIHGSTFLLDRERQSRILPPTRRQSGIELTYPAARYNGEAMSLYWYAKSARDMPLLRFLAFYQSIEFYFPRYSQVEARKRASAILKSPTFRAHRGDDLDRLISAIQLGGGGGHYNERSQLRAVINECISAAELREYLTSSKQSEDHFSGRGPRPKYHKIQLANPAADVRNDVADRIYDIRCKIVHTKNEHSEDGIPMILPFSDDADYLLRDVELVEFVARGVLVASSDELA